MQMTPMEFGSWDPQLSAMVNITYVGTHLTNGQPDNSTACTTFFDQIGFIMGTSGSFFNVSFFILVTPSPRSLTIRAYGHQKDFNFNSNTIQGLDKYSGKAIWFMLNRILEAFRILSVDAANWPNVRSFSRSCLE